MAFIMLGDVGFAKLTSPTSHELEKKADFAEHQVAEGKPLLQFMGPGLDSVSLSFLFHVEFCNPKECWDDLVDLLNRHEAFPLSMGNGELLGQFVLTGLTRTATITTDDGGLLGVEVRASLKEYADPEPLKTRRAEKKQAAKGVKKPGKKKPRSKNADVPQLDAASRAAGYKMIDKKTVVRQ